MVFLNIPLSEHKRTSDTINTLAAFGSALLALVALASSSPGVDEARYAVEAFLLAITTFHVTCFTKLFSFTVDAAVTLGSSLTHFLDALSKRFTRS